MATSRCRQIRFSMDLSFTANRKRYTLTGLTIGVRVLIIIRVQRLRRLQPDGSELPLRSMVGQLPLEQHIGVRIPEGQPSARQPGPRRTTLPPMAPTSQVRAQVYCAKSALAPHRVCIKQEPQPAFGRHPAAFYTWKRTNSLEDNVATQTARNSLRISSTNPFVLCGAGASSFTEGAADSFDGERRSSVNGGTSLEIG